MAAEDEGSIGSAGESRPGVACGVVVMLDGEALQFGLEPRAGLEPGRAPRDALRSVVVGGQGAELLEIRDCPARVCRHVSPPEGDRLLPAPPFSVYRDGGNQYLNL